MKLNKFVCVFVCLSQVKKTFSVFFYFCVQCRENMVLVEIKSQKTLVPSGFKGQKNSFYDFLLSRLLVEKTWFCPSRQKFPKTRVNAKNISTVFGCQSQFPIVSQ
jgi:hypothetical protein